MSNYPEWWNTTITIFNKYEDTLTRQITWFKHVVDGVFWKDVSDKVELGGATLETNKIICRVREDASFKEKYLWVQEPNDKKADYFTLGQGDIIVKYSVDDSIDEYEEGHRSTDIIAKYKALQGCMEVDKVSVNVGGGRNNPHYRVEGI